MRHNTPSDIIKAGDELRHIASASVTESFRAKAEASIVARLYSRDGDGASRDVPGVKAPIAAHLRELARPGNDSIDSMRRAILLIADEFDRLHEKIAVFEEREEERAQVEAEKRGW